VRLKLSRKPEDGSCGEGKFHAQVYSRTASLVKEFCLDQHENKTTGINLSRQVLRQAMAPCHFSSTTAALISDEGTDDETAVQFNPYRI
jgi:hypothetical protein